jgi:hypothetical protein
MSGKNNQQKNEADTKANVEVAKKAEAAQAEAKMQLDIMDQYGVDEIYRTKDGAYFTNRNLAENNTKKGEKVRVISREVVEKTAK